jgi:hypothetical protein
VVIEQRPRRLHVAGAGGLQSELRPLVGHLPLQLRDLCVQRLGGLSGLRGLGDLRPQCLDLFVLGRELRLSVAGAHRLPRRLLLLRPPLPLRLALLPLLCLLLRLRAIDLTRHNRPLCSWADKRDCLST